MTRCFDNFELVMLFGKKIPHQTTCQRRGQIYLLGLRCRQFAQVRRLSPVETGTSEQGYAQDQRDQSHLSYGRSKDRGTQVPTHVYLYWEIPILVVAINPLSSRRWCALPSGSRG